MDVCICDYQYGVSIVKIRDYSFFHNWKMIAWESKETHMISLLT